MFETLKLSQRESKAGFEAKEPQLRGALIDAQFDLREAGDFPTIVLLAGADVLGRSAPAKRLMSWMDPRLIRPYAAIRRSAKEGARPHLWRFWRALPRKGRVGILLTTWYADPTRDYFMGRIGKTQFKRLLQEIVDFERLLFNEGALFRKYLFLRPKDLELEQLRRLRKGRAAA